MQKLITILILVLILFNGCEKPSDPQGDGKVIILMYHSITEGEPTNLYERSSADFESDLNYLISNNITVIGFNELEEMVKKRTVPRENMAIITFDDCDITWLTNVKPLLLKYEMEATFFLWVSQIGTESGLTWEEIDLLSHYTDKDGDKPFIFASHTMNHHFLLDMKEQFSNAGEYSDFLDEELGGSKELIESVTPSPIKALSLPYGNGAGNQDIITAARRNGYSCIRTSVWDAFDVSTVDLYNLPSLPMLDASESAIIGTYLGIE